MAAIGRQHVHAATSSMWCFKGTFSGRHYFALLWVLKGAEKVNDSVPPAVRTKPLLQLSIHNIDVTNQ